MDGVDGGARRRRSFKERLGFIGLGCCGANWGLRSTSVTVRPEEQPQRSPEPLPGHDCVGPSSSGMNLAAALAAERQLRGPQGERERVMGGGRAPGTPWRVSLMRLLEETEVGDSAAVTEKRGGEEGNDSVCCVCMGRNKGAAFIPCGHTFCRVCSRELWLNRGSCPLCNRSIIEILDIF